MIGDQSLRLYSLLNLPPEKRRWLSDEDIVEIIEYRSQSEIAAIREATRLIQNLQDKKEAFTRISENQDTLASEVVMLSTLERMIFLRNVFIFWRFAARSITCASPGLRRNFNG